ncbi:hypothetical protein FHX82_005105 [Amycolatopsis bartoniae]|uniref:Uncharacterized protein n=1 Tax=Amycolatopsis bartoniae TaxID=941986 RepID=A0A8H9IZX4_9PSEU|nr:hypothetical protein [Amycolatopsis bartoniae]GHF71433.1 hypothetical protein GCM10017566_51640 [Amycolatopsis bartoniae]
MCHYRLAEVVAALARESAEVRDTPADQGFPNEERSREVLPAECSGVPAAEDNSSGGLC